MVLTRNIVTGGELTLSVTTAFEKSPYGLPVVVTQEGERLDPTSFARHQIIEADAYELEDLQLGGYPIRWAEAAPPHGATIAFTHRDVFQDSFGFAYRVHCNILMRARKSAQKS